MKSKFSLPNFFSIQARIHASNCRFCLENNTNSKSKLLHSILLLIFFLVAGDNLFAQTTYYSKPTGDANLTSTWGTNTDGSGTAPTNFTTSGSIFILNTGSSLTTSNDWTLGSGVVLTLNGTLSISGNNDDFFVNGTIEFTNTSATQITMAGAGSGNSFQLGSGAKLITKNTNGISGTNSSIIASASKRTVTLSTAANYEFSGAAQATTGLPTTVNNLTLSGSGSKTIGTVTVNGILTMSGTATASAAPGYGTAASLHYFNTTRTITGTANNGIEWISSFTASGGVVIENTATINLNVARTISTLTIQNGGSLTGSAAPTITTFNINNGGTYIQPVGTTVPGTTRTFGASSNYEFQTPGGGSFPASAVSFGNLTINTSSGNTSAGGNLTTIQGNLVIKNTTGGSYRLAANTSPTVTIGGNIQIDAGELDFSTGTGAPAVNVTGNVILNGGTLRPMTSTGLPTFTVAGNWTNNGGTFTPGTTTVTLNGTSQAIGGSSSTSFYNLSLAGSGTKTFGIATTVTNNLSISSGVVANLGTFSHTASTLTLGGFGTPSGTHGSTSSAATYKNNTYFSAASGIITVATSTCGTVTAAISGSTTICNGATANLVVSISGGASPYTVVYSGGTVNSYVSGTNIPVSPGSTTPYTLTSVTGANGCTASVSGTATITVRPIFTSGIISSTGQTICNGGTPTQIGSTTAASGGDGTITYSWRSSADGYTTAIGGAAAATYTPPAGLTSTTSYQRYATDGTCNTTPTVASGTWTVTVYAPFTSGAISSIGESFCFGGTPATISSTTAASGGDGMIAYSWRSSADGYVSPIVGATGATYTPSGLTSTTSFRRYAKDATCNTTPVASTGTWTVTVTPNTLIASGNWSAPGNWSCGRIPIGGEQIIIGTGFAATLDVDFMVSGSLFLNSGSSLSISPGKVLSISGSANFNDQAVTVQSTSAGNGSIGQITGSLSGATNVTIERYIPQNTNRAWRVLSVPTKGGQTIHQSWQENQAAGVVGSSGKGTIITGKGTDWATQGFDFKTPNYSMLTYDGATDALLGVTSTLGSIETTSGYYLYIRGDRSVTPSSSITGTTPTTLRTKGSIYTGTQSSISVSAGESKLIGNIYPSPVDMRLLSSNPTDKPTIYIWDPKVGGTYGLGAMAAFEFDGTNYHVVTAGGSYPGSSTAYNIIQPGQAFFVDGGTSGESVQFTEAAKTAQGSNFDVFSPSPAAKKLYTRLSAVNSDQTTSLADGTMQQFDARFSNQYDNLDARKLFNFGESFYIVSNHQKLVVEKRQPLVATDTIYFGMEKLKGKFYDLEINAQYLDDANLVAFLEDKFTQERTPLNLNGITTVRFAIDGSNAASTAVDRFRIVFGANVVLAITGPDVYAYRKQDKVTVEWNMADQKDVQQYEVEKSTNGSTFYQTAIVQPNAAGNYTWIDDQPASGNNFYRVIVRGKDGNGAFSKIAQVKFDGRINPLQVYPNPITTNEITLRVDGSMPGTYGARLLSINGTTLYRSQFSYAGGNTAIKLNVGNIVNKGKYYLEIVHPDKSITVEPVLFIK